MSISLFCSKLFTILIILNNESIYKETKNRKIRLTCFCYLRAFRPASVTGLLRRQELVDPIRRDIRKWPVSYCLTTLNVGLAT